MEAVDTTAMDAMAVAAPDTAVSTTVVDSMAMAVATTMVAIAALPSQHGRISTRARAVQCPGVRAGGAPGGLSGAGVRG